MERREREPDWVGLGEELGRRVGPRRGKEKRGRERKIGLGLKGERGERRDSFVLFLFLK